MGNSGALEMQSFHNDASISHPGYLLVANGPGTYGFDLYTGSNHKDASESTFFVGKATVEVGECTNTRYDDYTVVVDWYVTGSNNVCVSRDTTQVHTHAHYSKPDGYDLFEATCCRVGEPCYVSLDSQVLTSSCGDCNKVAPALW